MKQLKKDFKFGRPTFLYPTPLCLSKQNEKMKIVKYINFAVLIYLKNKIAPIAKPILLSNLVGN